MRRAVEAMLPLGPRVRALFLVVFLVGASAVLVGGQGFGFSSGIDEEAESAGGSTTTLVQGGCSCHNPQYAGTARAVLEGVPAFYTFGGETGAGPYNLTVRILGGPPAEDGKNQGGFNLQVVGDNPGELQVPAGRNDVQVMNGEATHTGQGNKQREWQVLWAPPAEAGADVQFILTVNSVNGNSVPDPGDVWGRATYVSMGTTRLGAAPEEHATEEIVALGVNFYAYWVGVLSFIVLFVVLAATFFLLRYGETRHWTDWKDRPARDKGEDAPKSATGTWVVLGVVLVVFVVAAVQVLRLV